VSTFPQKAQFNSPSGIACEGSNVYISDSGNRCIRLVKPPAIYTVAGNPTPDSPFIYPRKLRMAKGTGFVVDQNQVKQFSSRSGKVETIEDFNYVVSLDTDKTEYLYVLELKA